MENADLIKISKLFTDELTLDNLPRRVTCDTISVTWWVSRVWVFTGEVTLCNATGRSWCSCAAC